MLETWSFPSSTVESSRRHVVFRGGQNSVQISIASVASPLYWCHTILLRPSYATRDATRWLPGLSYCLHLCTVVTALQIFGAAIILRGRSKSDSKFYQISSSSRARVWRARARARNPDTGITCPQKPDVFLFQPLHLLMLEMTSYGWPTPRIVWRDLTRDQAV